MLSARAALLLPRNAILPQVCYAEGLDQVVRPRGKRGADCLAGVGSDSNRGLLMGQRTILWRWLVACVAGLLTLGGCGQTEVDVRLPADATEAVAPMVLSGSVAVGQVASVSDVDGVRTAHVVLDDDLGGSLLREGVVAWAEPSAGGEVLILDVTHAGDTPLSSPATLIAKRRTAMSTVEAAATRWTRNGTLWAVGVGAVAFIVLILGARIFLRSFAGLVLIAVSIAGAAFIAFLLNGITAAALVTFVYPYIGDGGAELAREYKLPEGIVAGLADPRVVAIFVIGLPAFVIIATLLRKATSFGKGRAA